MSVHRYLAVVGAIFVVVVCISTASNGYIYFVRKEPEYGGLLRYQLAKLAQPKKLDTIFVGDSSLGNAIRADLFDRLSGTTSANLALTGLYGFDGALNMLRRAAATHEIRNAIIVQSIDAFQRAITLDGYIFTAPDLSLAYVPWSWRGDLIHRLASRLMDPLGPGRFLRRATDLPERDLDPRTDYIVQRGRLDDRPLERKLVPAHLDFVMAIMEFCRDQKINCVFAHGPLLSTVIDGSKEYIEGVNAYLVAAGVPLATTDVTRIPLDKVGDSREHVHPDHVAEFTEIYARLLRPHLRIDSAAGAGGIKTTRRLRHVTDR